MRGRFAILLAIAAVCVTAAWAGWSPEEQITKNKYQNNLGGNNGHKIVAATGGLRHLVWSTGTTGVLYKRYYSGSGWTSDYKLTQDRSSRAPSIALDANGTDIHVVWSGKGTGRNAQDCIYYQKCVPGSSGTGGWVGSPRDISGQAPGRNCYAPSVACYQGHVAVTWEVTWTDSIGFCECVNGNWGTPSYFYDPSDPGEFSGRPSVAVDPQGRYGDVFISYYFDPDTSPRPWLCAVLRRQNGGWRPREIVSDNQCLHPCIEVDPGTGYPHIFGGDDQGNVWHTCWDASLGWRPMEAMADNSALHLGAGGPNAIFAGGSAFVVWPALSSSNVRGIMYSIGLYGNWTTPDWVTSGYADAAPSVSARSNGDVCVVWQDGRTSNNQIWGRLNTLGGGGGMGQPVALSQSGIELFPNPAKAGRVTVQYSLARSGPLKVALLDVSGRVVRTQDVSATRGNGALSIDLGGLNAGVFVVRITGSDLTISRKLVIQH